jgi:lipopolysaccharide transport system permease protein
MPDTHYTADPELCRPRAFLAGSVADLARSGKIAWCLFTVKLRARYRRAWLSYLWLLLPALVTVLVSAYVQSRKIVAIAPTELPYPLFVFSGMVLWQTFVEALHSPLGQLGFNRQLALRSRVPHEAIIASGMIEVLVNAAVRLIILVAAVALYALHPHAAMLWVPLGIAALALLGLALGLLLAPLGMLFEDIGWGIGIVTTFAFFVTPVLYPLPSTGLLRLNPVSPLIDATRDALSGHGPSAGSVIVTIGAMLLGLIAWLLYRVARPHVFARLA